jgi:hypothetical protein
VSDVFVIITTGITAHFPEMFRKNTDLNHRQILQALLYKGNKKIIIQIMIRWEIVI